MGMPAASVSPARGRSSASGRRQRLELLWQLTARDVRSRYRGAFFGIFTALFSPLVMLAVYAVVFGWFFGGRFGLKPSETRADYVLALYCGLVLFNYFSECLLRAPNLIVSQPNYVKKVIFPLELLPWAANGSALFHFGVNLVPLVVGMVIVNGGASPGTLWLLPTFLPMVLWTQATLYFLSALGVFFRDLNVLMPPLAQVLMFASAVFYDLRNLPAPFNALLSYNPLAQIVGMARAALIVGRPPQPGPYLLVLFGGAALCLWGARFFERCRRAFAEVI